MENQIVLVTKDAFGIMNLPIYGNQIWETPNIDELAHKGTVFMRHYTTAPSTGMAMTSMFTGKYPYELKERRKYL
ncbi:MAG: sulfatase-like hydrolase/transferase, partial [Verrucomicrobia bacterium]|nr:sulfatase-like hydrolase/transferase [Verrucomicrobiota bacterium]